MKRGTAYPVLAAGLLACALTLFPGRASASFSGQLKSTTDDFPYRFGPPTQDLIPYVSLELDDKEKLSKSWHTQVKLYGLTNASTSSPPENLYGDIHEAFVEYKSGPSKLQVGINTVNWAVVDGFSPSDVVNTTAIFNPLRVLKQGAPMVQEQFGHEELNLDLVYIPVARAPQLPAKDSRWLPREFLLNSDPGSPVVIIPPQLAYDYTSPETMTHALNNNAGIKLASHLGSFDLQLTHFEGSAPSPKIFPTVNATPPPVIRAFSPIYLTPIYYRVQTTGLGIVWAREKWIFRAESAYQDTITKDDLLQPWSWTNVVAAETNVEIATKTVTLLAQVYSTKNPQAADNMTASSYRLFDQAGMLGARIAYSDELVLTLSSLFEPQSEGLFAMLGFDNKLTDHLSWGVSWANFSAVKDGLLKTYAKDSHGTLTMTYFF